MSWTTLSTFTVTATKGEHHGVPGLFFYRDAGGGGGEVESYTDPYAEGLLGWGRQGIPWSLSLMGTLGRGGGLLRGGGEATAGIKNLISECQVRCLLDIQMEMSEKQLEVGVNFRNCKLLAYLV